MKLPFAFPMATLAMLAMASAQYNHPIAFTCPEGQICMEWTDGCNWCDSDGCTEEACSCYENNSCIPECTSNDQCVAVLQPTTKTELFDCPPGQICTEFSDGCNMCSAPDGNTATALCTEMYCSCYDDQSCVPACKDNDLCVPATAVDNALVATDSPCDPAGTDQGLCAVADCMEPPEGCTYTAGDFRLEKDGSCCQEQCVAVNANGNPCSFETAGDNDCTPTGNEACPVARCAVSPEGCQYKFDHYTRSNAGVCCPSLCYAVDAYGEYCSDDQLANNPCPAVENDDCMNEDNYKECRALVVEEGCTSINILESCPLQFACADLEPSSTEGKPDDTSPVETSSTEGKPDDDTVEESATGVLPLEEGDVCTPTTATARQATNNCPVASCAEAPSGCEYVLDHYVINAMGDCCPSLCYAVDSNGVECSAEEESGTSRKGLLVSSGMALVVLVMMRVLGGM